MKDVDDGLSATPKTLPSKYFYDAAGDALFVDIMHMPEYYLTNAEMEIFSDKTAQIIAALDLQKGHYFQLIELGAGDGLKTKKLLAKLVADGYDFDYFPVDISAHALDDLERSLKSEIPGVKVQKQQGDYFEIMESLKQSNHPQVVLFLGSSIGNMDDETASGFIYQLGANLHRNDKLLLGADQVKSADIVLPAYNDKTGITEAFNLNLLKRINRELGADFVLNNFKHSPEYSEKTGIAISYLLSNTNQDVFIAALNKSFRFLKGEKVKTEISRKYTDDILSRIIAHTDFIVIKKLTDSAGYFADYILERR